MAWMRSTIALGLTVGLAACQADPNQQYLLQENDPQSVYLADASDPCFPERRELETQGQKLETSFDGVLNVLYTVGGVLESIRQTGRASGTVTDSGVTVSGGYIEQLRQDEGNILNMVGAATRDIEAENRWIGWVGDAFGQLDACRKAGAAAIKSDYQAGSIERADAEAGLAVLKAAYREDIARARAIITKIESNTQTYVDVYNDIADDNEVDQLEVGPYRREAFKAGVPSAKVVKKTVRRKPRKRVTPKGTLTSKSPAPTVKPEVEKMQKTLLTNVRRRDAVIDQVETAAMDQGGLDLALGVRRTRHS